MGSTIENSETCVCDKIVSLWNIGSGKEILYKIMDYLVLEATNCLFSEWCIVMLSSFAESIALISNTDCISSLITKVLFTDFSNRLGQPSEIIGHCSWNNI